MENNKGYILYYIFVKPRTSRCKTEQLDTGLSPMEPYPRSPTRSTRQWTSYGGFLAVHNTGAIVTQGPTQPQQPNEEIAVSTDVDMYVRVAMEAAIAADATAAWRPANPPKQPNQLNRLKHSPKTGRGSG